MHVGGCDADKAGGPLLGLQGDAAEGLLDQVQQRQQGRALLLVFGENRLGRPAQLVKARNQWSSSPPIMLTDPKVGTTSASMSPVMSSGTAAMIGKQGGRTRTRYGRSEPSLTM